MASSSTFTQKKLASVKFSAAPSSAGARLSAEEEDLRRTEEEEAESQTSGCRQHGGKLNALHMLPL